MFFSYITVIPNIPANARWSRNGVTVAGGRQGLFDAGLHSPVSLFVDYDQTIFIADRGNHRIMQWKLNESTGAVVAGGQGSGEALDQLIGPNGVWLDKETDSLIICNGHPGRVLQWFLGSREPQVKLLLEDALCHGLFMDEERYLYVSFGGDNEVRRYQIGDTAGILVAGGHGKGAGLNQFDTPYYIFVDKQQTIYVSDYNNHRVMKWAKGATEGIVVAGGQGQGDAMTQLSNPTGLFVDTFGTIYVAEMTNNRVTRWPKGSKQGTVIAGGHGEGGRNDQFNHPEGLSFDRHSNLYVVDKLNNRVQRFSIE